MNVSTRQQQQQQQHSGLAKIIFRFRLAKQLGCSQLCTKKKSVYLLAVTNLVAMLILEFS